jgi:hypothetical protein
MKTFSEAPQPSVIRTRPQIKLSSKLEKYLSVYATAATAAGVSLFVLAQPAEAKVVFTPSNITITDGTGLIQLDLNHDGIPDFAFSASFRIGADGPPLGLYNASLLVLPDQTGNGIGEITSSKGFQCAAKLPGKVVVGPGKHFAASKLVMFQVAGDYTNQFSAHCPWLNRVGGFVGLKFMINGETHYGWARIAEFGTKFAAIRGYAYETTPDQPILTGATTSPDDAAVSPVPVLPTPRPATLAHLAKGASALAMWR